MLPSAAKAPAQTSRLTIMAILVETRVKRVQTQEATSHSATAAPLPSARRALGTAARSGPRSAIIWGGWRCLAPWGIWGSMIVWERVWGLLIVLRYVALLVKSWARWRGYSRRSFSILGRFEIASPACERCEFGRRWLVSVVSGTDVNRLR